MIVDHCSSNSSSLYLRLLFTIVSLCIILFFCLYLYLSICHLFIHSVLLPSIYLYVSSLYLYQRRYLTFYPYYSLSFISFSVPYPTNLLFQQNFLSPIYTRICQSLFVIFIMIQPVLNFFHYYASPQLNS